MKLLILLAIVIAALLLVMFGGCRLGFHRWDHPGGHCEECGACDEFFGPHRH